MSTETITYEQMMEQFRVTLKGFEEVRLAQKETDKRIDRLGNRIGELVEAMVRGGIVRLFQTLGYDFTRCSRNVEFKNKTLGIAGEVDLFLENGDYALLVEIKTNLSVDDVKDHTERLKKYRLDADTRGDQRRFIAAVGGGVVRENVRDFALQQGFYVIQQSGDNVEVIPPEGEPTIW
jgi:hypothetical protein